MYLYFKGRLYQINYPSTLAWIDPTLFYSSTIGKHSNVIKSHRNNGLQNDGHATYKKEIWTSTNTNISSCSSSSLKMIFNARMYVESLFLACIFSLYMLRLLLHNVEDTLHADDPSISKIITKGLRILEKDP